MSLTTACVWSFIRAIVVALLCLPIAWRVAGTLRTCSERTRRWLLAALLVPFLMPGLLIGFVYSETTLRVVRELSDPSATVVPPTQLRLPQSMDRPMNSADVVAEGLYGLILLLRYVPVAALMIWLLPAPRMSAEAIHCRRLLRRARNEPQGVSPGSGGSPARPTGANALRLTGWLSDLARGPFSAMLPAFAVVFLLTFQEFEIASLLQISRSPVSWAVWLFDNHAGGLVLSRSLLLTIGPVVCEVLVVGTVFALMLQGRTHDAVQSSAIGKASWPVSLIVAALALVVVVFAPLVRMSRGLSVGVQSLVNQPTMLASFGEELLISLGFAITSGLTAFWISGALFDRSRVRVPLALICVAPGLIGALVLSLVALALFQLPAMNFAYDTPLPMLLVLVVFLLPRALLLRLVFFARQPGEPVVLSQLLARSEDSGLQQSGRNLLWALVSRPAFWVVALLTYWAYWDLTIASILRSINLEPFTPRLYNDMHYGRNETLTAKTVLAALFPVVLATLALLLRRGVERIRR